MKSAALLRILFGVGSGLLLAATLLLAASALGMHNYSAQAAAGNLFVTPAGAGDCSQAAPCDLPTALGMAGGGETIYLSAGSYTGSGAAVITLTLDLTLTGGWNGSPSGAPDTDPSSYASILDGENSRRGVYLSPGLTVTLQGFTVTNGVAVGNGGGLYAVGANLTLRAMSFYSNAVTATDYANGGGVYVEGGVLQVEASKFIANSAWATITTRGGGLAIFHPISATVTNALFQDNDAWDASGLYFLGAPHTRAPFSLSDSNFLDNGRGNSRDSAFGGYAGALEAANAQAYMNGNSFLNNRAANDYGAVAVFSSALEFTGNTLAGNETARTAGLHLGSVVPFTVTNNIIAANRSAYDWISEPAVLVQGGGGQFMHNTIAQNNSAYGLLVEGGASVVLTNTILVSHTLGISVTAGSTAALEGTLWGSGAWANGEKWGGAGAIDTGAVNLFGDPDFVDPVSGDYHIGSHSAALNAGVDAGVKLDIDGELRPLGAGFEIGADEIQGSRLYMPLVGREEM